MKKPILQLINGKETSLSDFIVARKGAGISVDVCTFGINAKDVEALLWHFKKVTLFLSDGQSTLNPKMIQRISMIQQMNSNLIVKKGKIHSKLVLINKELLIVTSANLTKNYKTESYLTCSVDSIDGAIESFESLQSLPDFFGDEEKKEDKIGFDFDFGDTLNI